MLAVTEPATLRKFVGHTELILYDSMLNPVKYCANATALTDINRMVRISFFI